MLDKGFYDECNKVISYCKYALTEKGQRELDTDVDGMRKMLLSAESLSEQLANGEPNPRMKPPEIGDITVRLRNA